MERDTSSNAHSNTERVRKITHEECIDFFFFFLSGVCFAQEGQFNESTCRVPERGEGGTIIQRQELLSMTAIGRA